MRTVERQRFRPRALGAFTARGGSRRRREARSRWSRNSRNTSRCVSRRLFTSLQQAFINLRSGRPGKLPAPVDDIETRIDPLAEGLLSGALSCSIVGARETVRQGLEDFVARTGADELMVTAQIWDHAARVRSFEILAEAASQVRAAA